MKPERHGNLHSAGHGRRRRSGRGPAADSARDLHDRRIRPVPFLQGLHAGADPRRGPPVLRGGGQSGAPTSFVPRTTSSRPNRNWSTPSPTKRRNAFTEGPPARSVCQDAPMPQRGRLRRDASGKGNPSAPDISSSPPMGVYGCSFGLDFWVFSTRIHPFQDGHGSIARTGRADPRLCKGMAA